MLQLEILGDFFLFHHNLKLILFQNMFAFELRVGRASCVSWNVHSSLPTGTQRPTGPSPAQTSGHPSLAALWPGAGFQGQVPVLCPRVLPAPEALPVGHRVSKLARLFTWIPLFSSSPLAPPAPPTPKLTAETPSPPPSTPRLWPSHPPGLQRWVVGAGHSFCGPVVPGHLSLLPTPWGLPPPSLPTSDFWKSFTSYPQLRWTRPLTEIRPQMGGEPTSCLHPPVLTGVLGTPPPTPLPQWSLTVGMEDHLRSLNPWESELGHQQAHSLGPVQPEPCPRS